MLDLVVRTTLRPGDVDAIVRLHGSVYSRELGFDSTFEEYVAQLRWFLVDPEARGNGLGTTLLHESVAFCRASRYAAVVLWTVSALDAAARLYVAAGFRKCEE